MRTFSARDAAKTFGAVLDAADDDPVVVHRHGRPRAVVMGWSLYQRYKKAYDDAFDARQIVYLEQSLKALVEGRLGRSNRALALAERLRAGDRGINIDPPAEKSPES